jgi:hypothetical protein
MRGITVVLELEKKYGYQLTSNLGLQFVNNKTHFSELCSYI